MQEGRLASSSRELAIWSLVALLLAVWSCSIVRNHVTVRDSEDFANKREPTAHYSWIEDDYPAYYPMEVGPAIMMPEDTVHYPINGEDGMDQWETQFPTDGNGWVCLGPERRDFALTMYHELHCLGRLRVALGEHSNRTAQVQSVHVQHCLNYLRMMTLCRADVTLEPVMDETLTVDLTQPHLCRDWKQVYEESSRNSRQCKSSNIV